MKFVVTLHGETALNLESRLQGHIDTPLHEIGIRNALHKRDILKQNNPPITRIVSSDLRRAVHTAQIINIVLSAPHDIDPRLRECGYGTLQELSKAELALAWAWGKWTRSFLQYDFRPMGGECRDDVLKRHIDVFDDLKRKYAEDTILIVGHSKSMNTFLTAQGMLDLPLRRHEIKMIEY